MHVANPQPVINIILSYCMSHSTWQSNLLKSLVSLFLCLNNSQKVLDTIIVLVSSLDKKNFYQLKINNLTSHKLCQINFGRVDHSSYSAIMIMETYHNYCSLTTIECCRLCIQLQFNLVLCDLSTTCQSLRIYLL